MLELVMLTKEVCTGCDGMKMFIYANTKGEIDHRIKTFVLEENEEVVRGYADRLNHQGVPILVMEKDGEIIDYALGFNPLKVKELINKVKEEEK